MTVSAVAKIILACGVLLFACGAFEVGSRETFDQSRSPVDAFGRDDFSNWLGVRERNEKRASDGKNHMTLGGVVVLVGAVLFGMGLSQASTAPAGTAPAAPEPQARQCDQGPQGAIGRLALNESCAKCGWVNRGGVVLEACGGCGARSADLVARVQPGG